MQIISDDSPTLAQKISSIITTIFLLTPIVLSIILHYTDVPPKFSELQVIKGTLEDTPNVINPYKGSVYAWVLMDGKKYQIQNLCDIQPHCQLPDGVTRLKTGDDVTLWFSDRNKSYGGHSSGNVWQLAHHDDVLLSYDLLLAAEVRSEKRGSSVMIFMSVVCAIILAIRLWLSYRNR